MTRLAALFDDSARLQILVDCKRGLETLLSNKVRSFLTMLGMIFGVAAVVVGALGVVGASGGAAMQWLLFSVLSIVSLVLFRKPLMRRFKLQEPGPAVDSMIGEICTVTQPPDPDGYGRVELRGTSWAARAAGGSFVTGQRRRLERVDGLTFWIAPEGGAS